MTFSSSKKPEVSTIHLGKRCMKKNIWAILFVAFNLTAGAQQLPVVYNQFFMNPYVYNPAYAGVEGHAVVFATYKKQWLGIDGAPTVYNANFHIPLKGGLAFGAMAYSRQAGPYNMSSGKVSAGYLISIDREHFFRFGMSLGAGTNTIDYTKVEPGDLNSDVFNQFAANTSFMIGDVGVAYHFGHFNVGISLPKLFNYETITTNEGFQVTPKPQDNILFKMNYRGHINDNIAIEPHILYRYNKFLPNQYEGTVILHLLHIVWVGASYRQDAGFIGLLGAKFYEKLGVGYSYGYGNPANASVLGATHEIHIGYHIGTRKEHAEHVSSFIKSHRQSAAERAKQAELERQRQLQALQQSRQAAQQKEDEDALGLISGAKTEPEPKPDTHWSYEQESDPVERVNQFGETERGIKFDRVNEQGEKEVVFSWLPPPPPGATEETYEIASPGEEPMIRTKPDGTKEAGIKWIRTIDGTEKETLIIWDEILTEEEAEKLDHNPSKAMSLDNAVISIKAEPITPVVEKTQPEEEPETVEVSVPVQEEETGPVVEEKKPDPVVEEVKTSEKPVQEEITQQPVVTEEEKGDPALTDDFRTPEELSNSSDHLVVKKGTHMLELDAGNYVVAGVFESFQNAEDLSDQLFQRGFHETRVGYLTARGYYYVVIFQSDNLNAANTEKNRVKGKSGLSGVWVLKVNE